MLAALFAAKLATTLWAVNRGFDIGDEGFYLLNLNAPASAPPLFEFYKLLTLVDPPLHFGLIQGRLLRIATELVATAALALAVDRWARVRFASFAASRRSVFLGIGALGTLLTVGTRAFGYNDVTTACTFGAAACLFVLLALPAGGRARARLAWGTATGFGIGFQAFVKFPPAPLLLASAAALVWLARPSPRRERLGILAALGAGCVAAAGFFVGTNGGLAPLLEKWEYAQEVNRVRGYGFGDILRIYWHHDIGSHVNLARFATAFAVIGGATRGLLRGRPAAADRALTAGLVGGAGVLAWGSWSYHAHNVHPLLVVLFCSLLLLAPLGWALCARAPRGGPAARRPGREALAPLLLLLALPFFDVVGTNVALTLKLPTHVAPIFLMLAVLTPELLERGYARYSRTAVWLLAALTSLVFVEHHVLRPYGVPSPIYRQTRPAPGLPGLRIDPASASFLGELAARVEAAGFGPGDPVVALDFMPSLVVYLGGSAPGFPFLLFDDPAFNCWAINRSLRDTVPFLILGQDMSVQQHTCIEAFDFPQDFRSLGTLRNPWEHVSTRSFGGPAMPYVQLFAPKRSR